MTEIKMPSAGQTTDDATVMAVKVKVGDTVKRGDVLLEAETDKAVLPVESFAAGTVLAVLVEEGASVTAGTPLVVIGKAGESYNGAGAVAPVAEKKDSEAPKEAEAAKGEAAKEDLPAQDEYLPIIKGQAPAAPAVAAAPRQEAVLYNFPAMPGAKQLAKEKGIDIAAVNAANGEFVKRSDVAAYRAPAAPAPAAEVDPMAYTVLPMSRMRQIIGKRMLESAQTIPVWQCTVSVDMRALTELRELYKERKEVKLSYNDLMAKAIAIASRKYSLVNARYENGEIRVLKHTNVGLAVAQEAGLIVPVAKAVDTMSLEEISAEYKRLVKAARENKLLPADMGCGSITISNLGMFDVDQFIAIVNPPESCILAVGSIITEAVWNGSGFEPVPKMKITGSFDHRIIDGAYGAQFLKELKYLMEHPAMLLM